MAKKETSNSSFTLPNEYVNVEYILRQTGYITNPKHIAYGGKLEGATDTLPVQMNRNGNLKNVLTNEEKEYLEEKLNMDLSIYSNQDFWGSFTVKLGKNGIRLNLSDPHDYIKYKILLSYDDYVAKSLDDKYGKLTYKYVMYKDNESKLQKRRSVDVKKDAYRELGKLELSPKKLLGVLRLTGHRALSSKTDLDDLIGLAGQLVELNPKRFLEVLEDPNLDLKIILEDAVEQGVVTFKEGQYALKGGEVLSNMGQRATLITAVEYLNDPKNADILLNIKSKLK